MACFFFLSGYGLMLQYQKKEKTYLDGFLLKRVAPLYLICVIFILFYWGVNIALGETVQMEVLVRSFFFGGTIISKGWYLQAILLWYVLFFLSFRTVRKEGLKLLLLLASFALYTSACLMLGLDSTWYEGCFCLLLGVLGAKYRNKIDLFLSQKYILSLVVVLVFFIISFVFGNFEILSKPVRILSKCISASFFPIFTVLLLKIFPINNIITRFLGKLYLEIYLLHGFFLMFFSSKYISVENPLLYGVITLGGTLILATIIHPGIQKILTLGKKVK